MNKEFVGFGVDGCVHRNRKPFVFGLMVCDECLSNLKQTFREDFAGSKSEKEEQIIKKGKVINDKYNN